MYKNDENWIDDKWLIDYNNFTKGKDYYVKIIKMENHSDYHLIYMENLEIVTLARHFMQEIDNYEVNLQDFENLYKVILNILLDITNFKKYQYMYLPLYWIHDDFHLDNIVLLKDRSFKLIDPNAFRWKRGTPCNDETISALNRCLYMFMDYYYRTRQTKLNDLFKNVDHNDLITQKFGGDNDKQKMFKNEIIDEKCFSDSFYYYNNE